MAYAHKHVFSLSREISPGLVHRFSWVSLWKFQEHGVFVCWIQIALYVASKTLKNVKRVCMAGVTCVGTMAYAHKHVFSLSREIPPGPIHRFSWVSLWNFQEHGVFVDWIQIALYVTLKN